MMAIKIKVEDMVWDADESDAEYIKDLPTSFEVDMKEEDIADYLNGDEIYEELVWKSIEEIYPWCIAQCSYKFIVVNGEESL